MSANIWLISFKEAWEMLLDIPFPQKLIHIEVDEEEDKKELFVCFPLVGAVVGLGLYFIAWVINFLMPVSTAAAVVGSILLALLTESISSGGNIASLAAFLKAKKNRQTGIELVNAVETVEHDHTPTNQIFFLSLYLLKVFCFALLFIYGRLSWLVIVYTMSYLMRSQMAYWDDLQNSQPIIEAEDENYSIKIPWVVALLISLLVAGFDYFPAVVIVGAVAYLLLRYFKKISDRDLGGGVTGKIIGTAGVASELIFLLLGIILLVRN